MNKIKQEIIKKINLINDSELLKELDKWISTLHTDTNSNEYSKEEMWSIRDGYKQYRAGESVNQAESNRLFREWLNKK